MRGLDNGCERDRIVTLYCFLITAYQMRFEGDVCAVVE